MSAEITNLEEFKDKFAALMAAHVSLITAGIEPSPNLSSKIIDEFVSQFMVATPAPATPLQAGFVVVNNMTGYIPGDFTGLTYETEIQALTAIKNWVHNTGHGKADAYSIRKATYFV